ncbi:acylphosphatase [Mesobacillus harenae]|uniref:acylphosphatase n=1 Tax=Mesobacillus harenae TaxID=2213203 RepID=UPI0015810F6A|nr:acylphosphatase [Mesobacillus harenae]
MKQVQIIVSGNVQGVGYRYFSQMKAIQHDIRGWAKNLPDGKVEISALGLEEGLNKFINEIRHGNPFSNVENVEVNEIERSENYSSFTIKY